MSRPTWYPSPRWSSMRSSRCFVVRPATPERVVPPMTRGPFVDATGESFTLAAVPSRIVSLVPSVTELLFALGAGDAVAGCTIFCTEPARGVAAKTRVGGEKNPKLELIRELGADLVVANVEENLREHVQTLRDWGIAVHVVYPRTV